MEDGFMGAQMNDSRVSGELNALRGSFERGSMIELQRVQSLMGSMVMPLNDSTEQFNQLEQRDNSLEEDDGIPEVDTYVETENQQLIQ